MSNNFKILLTATVSLLCVSCCNKPLTENDFDFIWSEDLRDEMNVTMAFQLDKQFKSEQATLQLCAANGYMVFQDDRMIAYGPARTAHGYVRMDEIQLSGLTPDSKLTIDVIGNNINSFCYADEKPFFAARVISNGRLTATSKDFSCFLLNDRIQKVERFSYQRDFAEAYKMTQDRSLFYKGDRSLFAQHKTVEVGKAKLLSREAPYPVYPKVAMKLVEDGKLNIDESRPVWKVRFIDKISDKVTKGFQKEDLDLCISDEVSKMVFEKNGEGISNVKAGTYTVTDAGRTITGWFDLKLKVNEPTLFYVLFDEIDHFEAKQPQEGLNVDYKRNGCVGAVRYELEAGEYELVNFEQFSARFLKLCCVKGSFELENAELIAFENPEMYKLEFKCEDDSLNSIVRAAQNTLAQNAVDLFTDCPQRERAGWLCDAFFSAKAEFAMTGNNVIDKCFLENYALAPQLPQLPEGMVPMCYPGEHLNGEYIPNWAMWYVLQLYDYYKRTGDRELIDQSRAKVEGIINFFKGYESAEGLLENLESWVFIEWSQANKFINGINFPSNMIYSMVLDCAAELYGDQSLATKADTIRSTIAELSYNGKFFEDNMIRKDGVLTRTGNISETCQYYAFYCGLADKTSYHDLHELLFSQFGQTRDDAKVYPEVYKSNAFIGNYLRLEILRKEQRTKEMIGECKQFFHYMAERTGTLWEHSKVTGSLNHGFASYAVKFVTEAVTGISDYEAQTNTLYMSEPGLKMDCKAVIPLNGDMIVVDFEGDKREIVFPEGLNVIYK